MRKTLLQKYRIFPLIALLLLSLTMRPGGDLSAQTFADNVEVDPSSPEAGGIAFIPGEIDLNQRVTLDLRNMEVSDALRYISLRSGMNIVTSKLVSGRLSFQLKNVPLKDVFDVTLLSNNLAYEKQGEIFYVMTDKEYQLRFGENFGDARVVKVLRLNYAIPAKAFDLLDALKSKIGRLLVDQDSGTVMIMDTPENIAVMEEALASLESKNDVRIFNLNYATAADVTEKLKSQLDKKNVGSVIGDERTNQVIVQTLPERMNDIKSMITALDKKTQEVMLDAKIVKIKLSDDLNVGVQWEGMFRQLSHMMGGTGFYYLGSHPLEPVIREGRVYVDDLTKDSYVSPGSTAYQGIYPTTDNPTAGSKSTGSESIYLGRYHDKKAFETVFKFLQTLGDTKILSNPKISVIDNHEAIIHVGKREAYITTTTTTGQATTTTAEEVTFIDVGIKLSVTPTINEDNYVTLKVKPEISDVIEKLITPSGNEIPIVDTSLAETTVMVKDGTTIIIGGLRKEEKKKTEERVPFLSNIPIFGNLFKDRMNETERTELVVMITPYITGGDDMVTGNERWDPRTLTERAYSDFEITEGPERPEPGTFREY
ncbi:MAG: secretin N-terminal domain-containing protein [Candidatus Omnitrophota bacterium]